MINLQWGGYTNGSVPDSALTVIDSAGHRLEHVAAANFLAMQAACLREVGRTFWVAPGADSADRTLAQQQADWATYQNGGNTAAWPGTSNHGWARAVDITGYETAVSGWVFGQYVNVGAVWRWLMANMARFGFSWDTGRASRESWHFESYNAPSATASVGGVTPITNTTEEDDDDMNAFYVQSSSAGSKYRFSPATGKLRLIDSDEWNFLRAVAQTKGGVPLTIVTVSDQWLAKALAL